MEQIIKYRIKTAEDSFFETQDKSVAEAAKDYETIYETVNNESNIELLKQQQYEELFPTDWYFVRKIETGIEVPEDIIELRENIRKKYYDLISSIKQVQGDEQKKVLQQ